MVSDVVLEIGTYYGRAFLLRHALVTHDAQSVPTQNRLARELLYLGILKQKFCCFPLKRGGAIFSTFALLPKSHICHSTIVLVAQSMTGKQKFEQFNLHVAG